MEIQTNSKIDFSSHRVTVAWRQSLMKRHENTRLCISGIIGPIKSKLDMSDKSPGLMTSTQKSWLKMTAPPGGNRKCLVFCMSYTWMYSSSPTACSHVKLYQMGLKTLIMKAYDYCDFSSNAILVAWRQSSSTRRDTRNYYNFGVGGSTSLKLHLCNHSPPPADIQMCSCLQRKWLKPKKPFSAVVAYVAEDSWWRIHRGWIAVQESLFISTSVSLLIMFDRQVLMWIL